MTINCNLFQGEIVDEFKFRKLFYFNKDNKSFWAQHPISHDLLFTSLEKITKKLVPSDDLYKKLISELQNRDDVSSLDQAVELMSSLISFIQPNCLRTKMRREFGTEFPFELKRISFKEDHFESWYPLGLLIHVTPNNSPILGVLGVIEGLLSGNVNILKLARKDGQFAAIFFHELCRLDDLQILKNYLYIGRIPSTDRNYMRDIFSIADGISAWGSEESLKNIRELAPQSSRVIEWGHKISFSYVSKLSLDDEDLYSSLAQEICQNEQMACSSPQCVFIEDASLEMLKNFAFNLSIALEKISPQFAIIKPDTAAQAEITVVSELVRLNSILGKGELITSKGNEWRLFIDLQPSLNASPLFRSLWIKPMPRNKIVSHLRPLKNYLQTAGLWAQSNEIEAISKDLFLSGVQRVRKLGEMTDSYLGEPHDGVFALQRYCQKITFSDSKSKKQFSHKNAFEEIQLKLNSQHESIMEKSDFQKLEVNASDSDLFFYSGGSSGEPKLSIFTYEDYHRQMDLAAEGLFAAGLDPKADRCMNLFYAGNLYGGFISFFSILEKLQATQFPMGASTDYEMVGKTIIDNKVNTLLGMPSYLIQLFSENRARFKEYNGIRKLYYGGEHFSVSQRDYLKSEFGVNVIRSASYGSVDAGPLGYQCIFSTGTIHHLHERLHELEVVSLEEDKLLKTGEIGRFLFTSKVRRGQKIIRYAIGDVGKIIEGDCECGRRGVRFELMGRQGDVFRIGTVFLSYQRFQKIMIDHLDFQESFQIHLHAGSTSLKEKIIIKIENHSKTNMTKELVEKLLLDQYHDLAEAVRLDKVLDFEIIIGSRDILEFTSKTGKLKNVIDHRVIK